MQDRKGIKQYQILCVACNKQLSGVKTEMEINNRKKNDLNQQRLNPFLCNVILYRIIEIFKTACKIDPH